MSSRRLLSTPVVLCAMLVTLTFCFCTLRFSDPDTWLHLKIGQEIWQTHSIPTTDHWSFTVNGNSRINHEWLAELWIYLTWHLGGYRALQLWLCLLAGGIVALVYAVSYLYSGNAGIAMLGGFLAFFFGTVGFSVRPHMVGYAFLALELLLVERGWGGRKWILWCLPPLFLIWVNCHGSWMLGMGILTLCCVFSRSWRFWKVLVVCACALLVNPLGVKLLLYPLDPFLRQRASLDFLTEWLPLSTHDMRGLGLLVILGAIGAAALLNLVKASVFELLILVVGTILAVQHIRMLFVFGIVCAPIFCRLFAQMMPARRGKPDSLAVNAVLLSLCTVCCAAALPSLDRIEKNIQANNPVQAVQFIRQSGLKGNMLHDYIWGGYLAWALPEHKVFIDGRGDVFDWAGVLASYRDWATIGTDPTRLLDQYNIRFCILPVSATEAYVLPHLPGWRRVYTDEVAAVFAREGSDGLSGSDYDLRSATAGTEPVQMREQGK